MFTAIREDEDIVVVKLTVICRSPLTFLDKNYIVPSY